MRTNSPAILAALGLCLLLLTASCGGKYDPYPGRPHAKVSPGRFSFSADGKQLVTDFESLNFAGIFLFDSSGCALEQIGKNDANTVFLLPIFSPDGTRVVFVAGPSDGPFCLYLLDLATRELKRLTSHKFMDFSPVFSPQGDKIYFSRHKKKCPGDRLCIYDGGFYSFDLRTNHEQKLTNLRGGNLLFLHIFPGGQRFMFCSDLLYKRGHMLYTFDLQNPDHLEPVVIDFSRYAREPREIDYDYIPDRKDPSIKHRVVSNAYYEIRDFALSRDGKTLAFSWSNPEEPLGRQNEGYQLYVTDLATRKPRKLTSLPDGAYARSISPDGKVIYFTTLVGQIDFGQTYFPESTLWRINADGTGLAPVSLDFSGVVGKQPWITDNQALLAMKAVAEP